MMNTERLKRLAQLGDTGAAKQLLTRASRKDDIQTCMEIYQILFAAGLWQEVLVWIESRIKIHTEENGSPSDTAWLCNHLKRIFVLNRQIKCPECGGSGIYKNRNGSYFGQSNALVCGRCDNFNQQTDFLEEPLPEIDESKLPPAEDVLGLWGQAIKVWWPDDWMRWLANHDGWVIGVNRVWFGYGKFFVDKTGWADTDNGQTYPDLPDVPKCICDTDENTSLKCKRCGEIKENKNESRNQKTT